MATKNQSLLKSISSYDQQDSEVPRLQQQQQQQQEQGRNWEWVSSHLYPGFPIPNMWPEWLILGFEFSNS